MKGKFYCVGVGPGDGELITLKALRIIERTDVIAAVRTEKRNCALDIVSQITNLREKKQILLDIPMVKNTSEAEKQYQQSAEHLLCILSKGQDVVLLTLGDPAIYSTAARIWPYITKAQFRVEIVPGVPSFCAAAALTGQELVSRTQPLTIIPASIDQDYLQRVLQKPGTKIIMKPASQLKTVAAVLRAMKLHTHSTLVQNCGMNTERCFKNLDDVPDTVFAEHDYFSLFIIRESK